MSLYPKNIIIANYSIHSLALIIWAKENLQGDFCVISVDTKFASSDWYTYLKDVFSWLNSENIKFYHLDSENSFSDLVIARKQYPSQQFSWCAGFLKGITILNKIDKIDADCASTILLSHRKDMSKVSQLLENKAEEEKYDFRELRYPLLNITLDKVYSMVTELPFTPVTYSKECSPCIHITDKEFTKISSQDIKKTIELEENANAYMFNDRPFNTITEGFFRKNEIMQELSKACSWEYSCGL